MKNEVTYQIRVNEELKNAFIESAKAKDRTAAQLLRDFMRDYVKKNGQGELL